MKVFYDERQSVNSNDSFSPSAEKPAKVLDSWRKLDIPFDVISFDPLSVDEIALAHDWNYVNRVMALKVDNGFGNRSPMIAKTLPWVSGSMVAAALHSYHTGELSFSPTFNSVRYRYLSAIYLSDFDNPQQYMDSSYNKAFQALAGIEVTQANDAEKKDNDYFWQEVGLSRQARDLDWGKDIADLDRILGILRINNLRFDYPKLYKELIAIKPGFHELMIHGDYFDKTPVGDTLRDNVLRMLRGIDGNDDYHVRTLPQDIETITYFRYAPCHVTEGPFALRKSLAVSYFDEICKIDSKEKLECVSDNFYMVVYNKLAIDSKVKLTTCLNETKKFTRYFN